MPLCKLLFLKLITLGLTTGLWACQPSSPPLPTPAPAPTVSLTASNTPTPVSLSDLATFTHASQRFSLAYPVGWDVFEQDNGVIVLAPGEKFGYSVVFTDVGQLYTPDQMKKYIASFVAQNFADTGLEFKALSYQPQANGSTVARFSTIDPELGPTIGQVNVRQQGPVIYVVYINAPETQWPVLEPVFQTLADSLTVAETAPPASATPTPPVWVLVGPASQEFGFLASSNWQTVTKDDYAISVSSPEQNMVFAASSFPWPGALSNPQAATEAALAHIAELQANFSNVQHLPPAVYPLDTATGTTIDFVYTTAAGQTVAGSVITAVGEGKMHKIVFTAPPELYDLALEWFNPMLKSFKFLSPQKGLNENEK